MSSSSLYLMQNSPPSSLDRIFFDVSDSVNYDIFLVPEGCIPWLSITTPLILTCNQLKIPAYLTCCPKQCTNIPLGMKFQTPFKFMLLYLPTRGTLHNIIHKAFFLYIHKLHKNICFYVSSYYYLTASCV